MTSEPFFDVSPWVASPPDLCPPLRGAHTADVVIVGGGFTGLSTALALRDQGVDVALIEQDYCGMGASGRNAGHLTPTIGKDFPTLVKAVGQNRAVALARFGDRTMRYTEQMFKRLGVDCEYAPVGNIVAGLHHSHRRPLEQGAELAARLGVEQEFVDEAAARRRHLPEHVRFGVFERAGGHLHPGKYVMALRAAAIAAGARIFETSPVTRIDDRATPITVRTEHGTLSADKLVLATNAYTPATLGRLKSAVIPMRVTLFRTRVLSEAEWGRIGWDGREGIYTAHEAMENYRPQHDGRISGGSKYVQYGYASTLPPGNLPDVFAKWRQVFAQRFPELPDLGIEAFWGGWIGMTLDYLPIHRTNRRGTVFSALGYNGHGIAQATYAGSMVADRVLGTMNEDVELFRRRVMPLPPEPLRWLAVQGIASALGRVDRTVDAALQASQR